MTAQDFATQIVRKLVDAGHIAYFAGGWVRDYALGHPSADIDIATSAKPEEIIALFSKTILVGLAFGVVVVVVDGHQFEVASFREDLDYRHGRKPEKIIFSGPEEDALRRDFTINGMFYDPLKEEVHDFVGGMEDLKKKIVKTIGHPWDRFREDRLRMIRAVRFAARFGFAMDEAMQEAIVDHADTLFPAVAVERVLQEFSKMAEGPRFGQAFVDMQRLGLLSTIFPTLQGVSEKDIQQAVEPFRRYPQGCPTCLYLQALFPHMDARELLGIFQELTMSKREQKLSLFFRESLPYLTEEKKIQDHYWVQFYAHPDAELCLAVAGASAGNEFLEEHQKRAQRLLRHIERVRDKCPLVTAAHLQEIGIPKGPQMGQLLKEAEQLAITKDLHDVGSVIALIQGGAHGR